MKCVRCNVTLTGDDIGLTKKLLGKAASELYCVPCLAEKLGVSEKRLREKIEEFRRSGCMLFTAAHTSAYNGYVRGDDSVE